MNRSNISGDGAGLAGQGGTTTHLTTQLSSPKGAVYRSGVFRRGSYDGGKSGSPSRSYNRYGSQNNF